MTDDAPVKLDILNLELLHQVNFQVVKAVHDRDHYVCRFCGFRSMKYQQIVNPSGNWRDIDSTRTACIFCQQCFSLNSVINMRSGVLIDFPRIEQTELNRLAIEIYVALTAQDQSLSKKASECLGYLKAKREDANKLLETEPDNPEQSIQKLRDYKTNSETPKITEEKLSGIRLFPLSRRIIREAELEFNQFPQILVYWRSRSGPFASGDLSSFQRIERFAETYL